MKPERLARPAVGGEAGEKRIDDDDGDAPAEDHAEGQRSMWRPARRSGSPLLSNIYLNEVDRMLERAREVTRNGEYTYIEYARFADDLVTL